ncbi:MAG: hypothetical protein A07HR60_00871 [uncultured archaeon A07HR60]|nr:MAG: hypothetical protein A07HR60_00871 [uncultured archaeon A07HR60]
MQNLSGLAVERCRYPGRDATSGGEPTIPTASNLQISGNSQVPQLHSIALFTHPVVWISLSGAAVWTLEKLDSIDRSTGSHY